MGDVVSISRVSDLDIFSEFDAQCPSIPDDIDIAIQQSAMQAVGVRPMGRSKPVFWFRSTCVGVVLMSMLALAVVMIFKSQFDKNFPVRQYSEKPYNVSDNGQQSWRQSRESWQAYIVQLQSDPVYLQLQREKKLFEAKYP